MAIIKTYPLKSNYYGSDKFLISDMQPDATTGIVSGDTKNITFSSLKSFIGSQVLDVSASTDTRYAGTFVSPSIGNVKVGIDISSLPNLTASSVDGADKLIINSSQDNKKIRINELFETVGLATNSSINYTVKLPSTVGSAGQVLQLPSAIGSSPHQLEWSTPAGSGTVIGTGTTNRIPIWTNSNTLGDSEIFQSGTGNVGIGTTTPTYKLDVNGDFRAKGITSSSKHTVTIEAITGWYRIMQWSGPSRGGAIVKLSTTGGNVTPTTYVINAYKTYGSPANSNTLKLEQYGNFGAITKARIATDSVTGVTYVEIYNAYTSASYTIEVYHDSLLGLDSLTSVLTGQLQTGPNSVSQGELPFVYEGTTTEKLSSELVTLIGDGTNDGKLRFNCSANSHYVEIVGPTHSGGSSYSLKLPNTLPSVSNQILESNASGALSWIPTPAGSGGITFNGTTANGLVSRGSATQANVNSQVKLLANGIMTFDGQPENVGIEYDSGTSTLKVGDIEGNSESVALYSDGDPKITVSDSDVTVIDTTQFNSGLKFGSTGETLNSYEEGTWTPTSGTANTISSAGGDYTRIGNMVFAQFSFTMTGATAVVISGLPFQGVYTGSSKGGVIISADSCTSVQGQLKGGKFTAANSFTFNSYNGSGGGLPTQLRQVTSSLYQTSGGTYAGIIIYETTA